jgi:hypothetical protein
LEKTFERILTDLQSYYKNGRNYLYMTLIQKDMLNEIRSGCYVLQSNDAKDIVTTILSSLNRFLHSNHSIVLDDSSFECYFKVLSELSINDTKHRRKSVPISKMVGVYNFDQSSSFLKGSLRELPRGYPENCESFKNMCLLTSVIYCYIKIENPEIHKKIKTLLYSKTSIKMKNEGGRHLEKLINKLCSECNLSQTGPHDLDDTLTKVSSHLNIQINVIRSMDGAKPAVDSFPPGFRLDLPRIYLLLLRDDHIVAIENLKTFFDAHKKFICLGCNQFFSESRGRLHRCFKLESCFNCTGIFETPKTVKHNYERFFFCDSKLPEKQVAPFNCPDCNLQFSSQKCFSNHQRLCRSSTAGDNFIKLMLA